MQFLYTLLLYLIQPAIWGRLLWRSRKAPAYRKRILERYGFCKGKVSPGGILLHSVSVGETLAAIPLVRALRYYYPDISITVTTMTPTGSERVRSAFGNGINHVYLPYDLPCALHRFFCHVQPCLVIVMETELWPNMITYLHKHNIPLVIANARLSERSAQGYRKLGKMIQSILQRITLIAVQTEEDGEQFKSLGVKRSHLVVMGSIKFDIAVTPGLAAKAVTLRRQWAHHRPVWIAASTHEGEDQIILQSHKKLLQTYPDLLLILAPRHPERFSQVCQLVNKMSFSYITRTSGQIPNSSTQVVVADTMGELMLFYGISDLAFVGGSLIERGGHNPLEPAAHAIPVLMGPHTFNFKDICNKLTQAGALITVTDESTLVNCIKELLNDSQHRQQIGHAASEVLHQNQGALARLLTQLKPYLPQ